ncbi:alpha/beta hydrolase [Nonomuraea longicatena]|uniref:Alpha/beta hydrolase n=1 Tax=Nonomuraea longicatena TaxID=83682 RepID=A0ABP3ZHN9_9ACTN
MAVDNIVLVHGAWGDGSHWRGVIPVLAAEGYNVTAVQNPLTSLADDVHRTATLVAAQGGPTLLVGHSYGGSVISGAGNSPDVAGLVYIAAFAPDEGENLAGLLARDGQGLPEGLVRPDADGFLWLDFDAYQQGFAQDLTGTEALILARTQKPIAARCFEDAAGPPAWRRKPTWYQVSAQDRMIPPATERWMAERMEPRGTLTLEAGHASLISHPDEVAALVVAAAQAL